MNNYVGREHASGQLDCTLTGGPRQGTKLVIQSIEGPGGIGKTALFEHVLQKVDRVAQQMLTMRVSGSRAAQVDPFQLVQTLVASSEVPVALKKPLAQRFTNTEEVRAVYGALTAQARGALAQALPDLPIEALMKALGIAVASGLKFNEFIPKTKLFLNFEAIEKRLPAIEAMLNSLPAFRDELPGVLEKLGLSKSAALRNAVRGNALNALAEAFVSDLTALMAGYDKQQLLRPAQAKVPGLARLLLVVDDYEALSEHFGEFLVSHLVPRLKLAPFETVLVIVGRDQLALTHPGWSQHHQRELRPALPLAALSRAEMDAMVSAHGRSGKAELDRAWTDTLGYPLLVTLWLEEAQEAGPGDGPSIGLLKRFHDRTTYWLSNEQKRWLYHALHLPAVNVETFAAVLGEEAEARRAMDWFQGDGSVRDAQGKAFRVRPYVRSRLADYLAATDPAFARALQARAQPLAQ